MNQLVDSLIKKGYLKVIGLRPTGEPRLEITPLGAHALDSGTVSETL